MRHFGMLFTTAAVAAALAVPSTSGADPTGICSDSHLPFPVMNERDEMKDKNNNGIVCRKVNDEGQIIGGPDDTLDDEPLE